MTLEELFEGRSTNILVCDVQPGYRHHCDRIAPAICDLANSCTGQVVVLFNGEGLTDDSQYDVAEYLMEHGLESELWESNQLRFVEKEYGFFRAWMDSGVGDRIIIKVIRAMVQSGARRGAGPAGDSRDLELKQVLTADELRELESCIDPYSEGIYLPGFLDLALLKKLSPFYLVGGGRRECLREIELICNAFNIRYTRIDRMIYPFQKR